VVSGPTTSLRLRVTPGARRSGVIGRYGDAWKVSVAAAPDDGKANAAVLELLAETLGVSRKSVELVTGSASRVKVVAFRGLTSQQADERLAAVARDAC